MARPQPFADLLRDHVARMKSEHRVAQREVAAAMGISQALLQDLMSGKRLPQEGQIPAYVAGLRLIGKNMAKERDEFIRSAWMAQTPALARDELNRLAGDLLKARKDLADLAAKLLHLAPRLDRETKDLCRLLVAESVEKTSDRT